MKRYLLIATCTAILLLSGCMVGPRYVKPSAPLALGFKETTNWKEGDGWKIATPNDGAGRGLADIVLASRLVVWAVPVPAAARERSTARA